MPEEKPEPAMARTKSMSRYRKSRVASKTDSEPFKPPVPAIPRASAQGLSSNPPMLRDGIRRVTEPVQSPQRQSPVGNTARRRPQETDEARMRRMGKEAHEREELRRKVQKETQEQERIARIRKAEEDEAERIRKAAEDEAERIRIAKEDDAELVRRAEQNAAVLAEQKRKDLERLQAELDAAAPTSPPPTTSPRDKLRFFSRKRAQTTTRPQPSSREPSTSLSTTRSNETHRVIEQGGGGIVPQIDAPISASNAGERVSYVLLCKDCNS